MAVKTGYCTLAAILLAASGLRRSQRDCYSVYDGQHLLRFNPGSSADLAKFMDKLVEHGCMELGDRSKEMMAICPAAQAAEMVDLYKGQVTVLEKDAGAFFRNSSGVAHGFASPASIGSSDFYSDWRDFHARMARVEAAVSASGSAAMLEQIGTSVEGRPIMAVRIRGAGWSSGSPRVVADFQLHAREWIAGMAGVHAVEKIVQKAAEDPSWLAGMEVALVPLGNPDGIIYSETSDRMWRKNRAAIRGSTCKGIDLNRNWDPDWAGSEATSGDPCSDIYYGPTAFSEPETRALKDLIDEAPVSIHIDVHSFTQVILAPWSYTAARHPQRAEIDVSGKLMQDAVKAAHGVTYQYGATEILYPASGVAPDYSTSQGAFGFTFELRPQTLQGGGFAPGKDQILPTAEECTAGILAGIDWAKDPYTTPPPLPTEPPADCPWYCSVYGCGSEGCDVCPQC